MLYAICLAGIPGPALTPVLSKLRERFSDAHVFRGAGSQLRSNSLTKYDDRVVDGALSAAVDAVFGKSNRPFGFCRKPERACFMDSALRKNCGHQPNNTCLRLKPDFFILIYQAGIDEFKLLDRFYYSASISRIPESVYNNAGATYDFIVNVIKSKMLHLGKIKEKMSSKRSPLLLPPTNFGRKDLENILKFAQSEDVSGVLDDFRRKYFSRSVGAYVGRRDLAFKAAALGERHGFANEETRPDLALSGVYRLGCQVERDFHLDVSLKDGSNLGGNLRMFCRKRGDLFPNGTHANLTLDDCVL